VTDRTLTVKFVGDADKLLKTTGQVAKNTEDTSKHVDKLHHSVVHLAEAFGVVEGAKKVVDFLGDATKAAIADENAMTRAGVSVKNAGENWKDLKPEIGETLEKMSDTSGFMKDDLANAFSKLELATGSHTKALKLENDAMNISAQTGKPLQAIALALGKAYDGNAGALKRVGLVTPKVTTEYDKLVASHYQLVASGAKLSESQKQAYALSLKAAKVDDAQATATAALDAAHKKFADGVAARSETMAGKQAIFNAEFENTKVKVGEAILPLLTKGMGLLVQGMDFLGSNKTVQKLFEDVQVEGEKLSEWVSAHWPQIQAAIEQAMTAAKNAWDNDLHPAFVQMESVIAWLVGQVQQHWAAIHQIIEGAMNIIRGIIDVVMGLITGDWDRAWKGIKEIVTGEIEGIGGQIKLAWEIIKQAMTTLGAKALDGIETGLGDLGAWAKSELGKLPAQAVAAGGALLSAASDLGGKILSGLKTGVGDLATWAGGEIGKVGNAISGAASDVLADAEKVATSIATGIKSLPGKLAGLAGDTTSALGDAVGQIAKNVAGYGEKIGAAIASGIKSELNKVIDGWNGISFSLPSIDTHLPGVGKIGGITIGTPDIPHLAAGGITTGPMVALIGDNPGGREAVIPLGSSAGQSALGGGGDTNITIVMPPGSDGTDVYQTLVTLARRGTGNSTFRQVFAT
jgi:phage-related protein